MIHTGDCEASMLLLLVAHAEHRSWSDRYARLRARARSRHQNTVIALLGGVLVGLILGGIFIFTQYLA